MTPAGTRAPLPLLLLGTAAAALAFTADHPIVLGALAAGAVALLVAAPGRTGRWFLLGGLVSALALVVVTPLVGAQGDLVLFRVPAPPLLDGEVTLEEVAAGAAAGLRLLAVAVLAGAVLAHADPDRLLAGAMRLAPRSALVCALAARLIPTLRRDAQAIGEAARLRGVDLSGGRRLARARRAAPLALPLVGASLERGMDVAEAMAARGYGSGPRTRLPEPRLAGAERVTLVLGALLALATVWSLVSGAGEFAFFPVLGPAGDPAGIALAAVALAALGGAALALRARPDARFARP
ncbi:MAG: energy-coupling factor transporter transmembrane protein EcfT [Thermoleophilia bacterium]|jgi:energy-coupling factor transport system permease protein|nr:energy-coupling factor transporter transmembrane protein EcfT [Thermoleophilia bacterium]